ncbi:hypothetical protein B0H13DRAFT_2325057 [Mycena leptocephala]|nr:hypothetical protein B0H13DRAFT_2325057 [Mycena leptocephala]
MSQRRNLRCPATDNNGALLVSVVTSLEKIHLCGCEYAGDTALTAQKCNDNVAKLSDPRSSICPYIFEELRDYPSSIRNLAYIVTKLHDHPSFICNGIHGGGKRTVQVSTLHILDVLLDRVDVIRSSRQSGKPGLSPGSIAGITCGIIFFFIVIGFGILLRVQRARRMNPVFHRELAQGVDRYDISVKSRPRMMEQQSVVLSRSAVPAAEQRQHFLAQMIRTVQSELAALSTAAASSHKNENENHTLRQQIEILQGRNRTLEGQLQSNWALGLSDEPPPEYLP